MKLIIDIPGEIYREKLINMENDGNIFITELINAVKNGTPLDSIIADIEAARDKDKLCEYPYNRCIDILRRAGE